MPKPFITLNNITIRLQQRIFFENTSWEIQDDQHWAILGPNGAGKSTLVRAMWGGAPLKNGQIHYHYDKSTNHAHPVSQKNNIGYVSFELHTKIMEHENMESALRQFANKNDEETTVLSVILSPIAVERKITNTDITYATKIAKKLDIEYLLHRSISVISTGEMRKTLIARALMKRPKLLILDEPFDGLDESSSASLVETINVLMAGKIRILLIAHRMEEIVKNITHVLLLKDGKITEQGTKKEMLTSEKISALYNCAVTVSEDNDCYSLSYAIQKNLQLNSDKLYKNFPKKLPKTLISMKNVTVRYGDMLVLNKINWEMKHGENWTIIGQNGSGKSTIVQLILGDTVQGYANDITLFGLKKGSGETIWDIKKQIGIVSSELQVQYRKKMTALDVIASGFYDSIGTYVCPTKEQMEVVRAWCSILSIEDIASQNYHQLSYGQKRMILLARSMVKPPVLLIVDEPCHGLDIPNRKRILDIIETIGETKTSLLYITHHREEILPCISHILQLTSGIAKTIPVLRKK